MARRSWCDGAHHFAHSPQSLPTSFLITPPLCPPASPTRQVHGCGNVGATVAKELVKRGANVLTYDIDASRANLPGCRNISQYEKWWATKCDAIVPCSASGLYTTERAAELNCAFLVGATNLPFASEEARDVAEGERGVIFVPEGITSAGAVIVDSIEHFANDAFCTAAPQDLYDFTKQVVFKKTYAACLVPRPYHSLEPSFRLSSEVLARALSPGLTRV